MDHSPTTFELAIRVFEIKWGIAFSPTITLILNFFLLPFNYYKSSQNANALYFNCCCYTGENTSNVWKYDVFWIILLYLMSPVLFALALFVDMLNLVVLGPLVWCLNTNERRFEHIACCQLSNIASFRDHKHCNAAHPLHENGGGLCV